MAVVAFDILKLADRLQARGVTAEQTRTAGQAGLPETNAKMKTDIVRLEERVERRAAEADARAQLVKNELISWVCGIGVAAIFTINGSAWTIIRYLPAPHP